MATSSITKNFVVSGNRQILKFAEALETSLDNKIPERAVNMKSLTSDEEIEEFY